MRGAKALASKNHVRRCRTAKGHDRRVRGSFLLLPPEIAPCANARGGNCIGTGVPVYGHRLRGITPPSDVTRDLKVNTNAGTAEATGVMPGAWPIQPGD